MGYDELIYEAVLALHRAERLATEQALTAEDNRKEIAAILQNVKQAMECGLEQLGDI